MSEDSHDLDVLSIDDFSGNSTKQPRHIQIQKHTPPFVRKTVAYHMMWLIGTLSLLLVIGVMVGLIDVEAAKNLSSAIIAPLIAVFGTVVGFFFGSSNRND